MIITDHSVDEIDLHESTAHCAQAYLDSSDRGIKINSGKTKKLAKGLQNSKEELLFRVSFQKGQEHTRGQGIKKHSYCYLDRNHDNVENKTDKPLDVFIQDSEASLELISTEDRKSVV